MFEQTVYAMDKRWNVITVVKKVAKSMGAIFLFKKVLISSTACPLRPVCVNERI